METGDDRQRPATETLRDHLAVLWRRRRLIALVAVGVTVVAVVASLFQGERYRATSEALLTVSSDVLGRSDGDPRNAERFAQTQARLARLPIVVRKTLVA